MPRQSQRSQSQTTNKSSQLTLEQSFQEINQNIDEQVSDLIRYIINRAGEHITFKKSELKKHVLPKSGSNFQAIIDKGTEILKNVCTTLFSVTSMKSIIFRYMAII